MVGCQQKNSQHVFLFIHCIILIYSFLSVASEKIDNVNVTFNIQDLS